MLLGYCCFFLGFLGVGCVCAFFLKLFVVVDFCMLLVGCFFVGVIFLGVGVVGSEVR